MSAASSVPPIEFVVLPDQHELRAIVAELYAAHHVLRSFGMRPEDLYVQFCTIVNVPTPGPHVTVLVRRGELEAVFSIRRVEPEWQQAVADAWTAFVSRELPKMSESELESLTQHTDARRKAVDMARVLSLKGMLVHLDPAVN